jgi:hypothetical protein
MAIERSTTGGRNAAGASPGTTAHSGTGQRDHVGKYMDALNSVAAHLGCPPEVPHVHAVVGELRVPEALPTSKTTIW